MPSPPPLHTRLREWCVTADVSVTELARTLGLAPSAVSHWLSGRNLPEPARLSEIARILKLDRSSALDLYRLAGVPLPPSLSDAGPSEAGSPET